MTRQQVRLPHMPDPTAFAVMAPAAPSLADRPMPGVEFEELVGGAQPTTARQRRWAIVALAVMAGVACLGFGGQLLGSAAESRRDLDQLVVSAAGPAAVSVRPVHGQRPREDAVRPTSPVAGQAPANATRLPLGFDVAAVSLRGAPGLGGLLVVGFVPMRESIQLRLLDPDGLALASTTIVSRPPAAAVGLAAYPAWSFETVLKASATDREGGPDGLALAIRWIAANGAIVDCTIPLAHNSGSDRGWTVLQPIALYASCT